jgi:hypothetical protein
MELEILQDYLAQAERHVNQGERIVTEQRERIYVLRRDGHNVTEAEHLLRQFEQLQAMHIADRDRLRAEAAATLEKYAARRRER